MSFNNTCSDHHEKAIAPPNPHFFIPILPASAHQEFLVPKSFLKNLSLGVKKNKKKQKCEELKAILRSNGHGKTWVVKLTEVNDEKKEGTVKRVCFDHQHPSWKDFSLHHELHVGDFLVFRHVGSFSFAVIVLDSTACEKEFPPLLEHPFFNQPGEQEEELNEDVEAAASARGSCHKSPSRRKFIVTIKKSNLKSYVLFIPKEFAISNGLDRKMCTVTLRDREEGRSWPVNLRYYINRGCHVYLSGGWAAFAKAKGLKQGYVCSFELIMKSSNASSTTSDDDAITFDFVVLTSTEEPPPPPPTGERSSTTFVTTLKPCNVKPRYILYLPHAFAKRNGLYKKTCVIMLRDRENGTLWPVNLSYNENRGFCQVYICGGWAAFAKAMGLKEGNMCSFEPSATATNNAIIFDFAVLNSSTTYETESKRLDHRHLQQGRRSSDKSKSLDVTSPRVKVVDADAAAGNFFWPSPSRFITTLKYYNFSQFTLGIPIEFARSNGLTENISTITVRDEDGKPWPMNLSYKKMGQRKVYIIRGGGWRAFCLGKGLKEGDICSFEITKSSRRTKTNKIVFDFRITRC